MNISWTICIFVHFFLLDLLNFGTANDEPDVRDLKCSTIWDCYPSSNDRDGKLEYCGDFPTWKVGVWEGKDDIPLNTCCLPDEDDGNYGGWSFSPNSGKGYCYCCDPFGTTCGDSHCARYSSGGKLSLGNNLIFYNSSTMTSGAGAGGGEKKEWGILFRKGKRIE